MNIFQYDDYREFLKELISSRKEQRGYQSKIAEAAGCQRSYLSQALRGTSGLTPDHAIGISQFLDLEADEIEHFFDLVNLDRAGTEKLRAFIRAKIDRRREGREDLAARFSTSAIESETEQMTYYSSWHWSAIHILTGIPGFETPQKVAARLMLPVDFTRHCLETLEAFGLVEKRKGGKWKITKKSIHLPKASPMVGVQHGNWRQRAALVAQNGIGHPLNYTSVQSISKKDFAKIKNILLKAIDDSRNVIIPSKPEDLTCFNCDFFRV